MITHFKVSTIQFLTLFYTSFLSTEPYNQLRIKYLTTPKKCSGLYGNCLASRTVKILSDYFLIVYIHSSYKQMLIQYAHALGTEENGETR